MANEKRKRQAFIGGLVEDNPLTSGATTLTSASLAAITGGVGSTEHMAIVLDPDGVDGAPEIAYITALTAGAGSATIARGQEGTSPRQCERDTPWLHGPTPKDFDGAGGGDGLIGLTMYDPATDNQYSTSSTTFVDVDATNLVLAFTGPPSGKALVRLSAVVDITDSSKRHYWNLRDSGGDVANTERWVTDWTARMALSSAMLMTGLTPGTSYSWKWGWRVNGASGRLFVGRTAGDHYAPAVMEAWAVNL